MYDNTMKLDPRQHVSALLSPLLVAPVPALGSSPLPLVDDDLMLLFDVISRIPLFLVRSSPCSLLPPIIVDLSLSWIILLFPLLVSLIVLIWDMDLFLVASVNALMTDSASILELLMNEVTAEGSLLLEFFLSLSSLILSC